MGIYYEDVGKFQEESMRMVSGFLGIPFQPEGVHSTMKKTTSNDLYNSVKNLDELIDNNNLKDCVLKQIQSDDSIEEDAKCNSFIGQDINDKDLDYNNIIVKKKKKKKKKKRKKEI